MNLGNDYEKFRASLAIGPSFCLVRSVSQSVVVAGVALSKYSMEYNSTVYDTNSIPVLSQVQTNKMETSSSKDLILKMLYYTICLLSMTKLYCIHFY